MSLRVGIDLASVADIDAAIVAHGERYLRRVFTDRELAESRSHPHHLAGRFAAKEATIKALDATAGGISWRSIAVVDGRPGTLQVELDGEAARLAGQRGVESIAVSLTHDQDHAAAVVLMETRP